MKLTDVKSIGIVGAGVMGGGIAQAAIIAGYNVVCRDLKDEILESTKDTIINGRFGLRGGVERGKQTQAEMDAAVARLKMTTDVNDLADCDLIIEAIGNTAGGQMENKPLKLKVWEELESVVKKEAVFASNTSVFTIADLAAATERKDRFIGMHFSSPANIMKMTEVVWTEDVTEDVIKLCEDVATRMGKIPVRVRDIPGDTGFVGNRITGVTVREAQQIVEEGVATVDDVNTAMKLGFNWPVGPLESQASTGWQTKVEAKQAAAAPKANLKSIGVVGAGVMGGGISQSLIVSGYNVVCRDLNDEILAKTKDTIINGRFGLKGGVERGKQTQEEMDAALARLKLTTDVNDLEDCDLIIEAIGGGADGAIENKPMKLKVWEELDRVVKPEAVFASNTSAFTIATLAVATKRKEHFVGMHLFSPANIMKLVEVVWTEDTTEDTIKLIEDLARSMGKTPVRVKDVPGDTGFIGNRVMGKARIEAVQIAEEKVATINGINTILKTGWNWPAGPVEDGARSGWE